MTDSHTSDFPKDAIYVALRVADLAKPYVPSVTMACDQCGLEVWVDRLAIPHANACAAIHCRQCEGLA